jgi:hypothetical protein
MQKYLFNYSKEVGAAVNINGVNITVYPLKFQEIPLNVDSSKILKPHSTQTLTIVTESEKSLIEQQLAIEEKLANEDSEIPVIPPGSNNGSDIPPKDNDESEENSENELSISVEGNQEIEQTLEEITSDSESAKEEEITENHESSEIKEEPDQEINISEEKSDTLEENKIAENVENNSIDGNAKEEIKIAETSENTKLEKGNQEAGKKTEKVSEKKDTTKTSKKNQKNGNDE